MGKVVFKSCVNGEGDSQTIGERGCDSQTIRERNAVFKPYAKADETFQSCETTDCNKHTTVLPPSSCAPSR